MKNKKLKATVLSLWTLLLCLILCFGAFDLILPAHLSSDEEAIPALKQLTYGEDAVVDGLGDVSTVKTRLPGVVSLKEISVKSYENLKLIPAGTTVGLKLLGDGVSVVGLASVETENGSVSPAKSAGLMPKDVILKVDGVPIKTVTLLSSVIEGSEGKPLTLLCRRDKEEITLTLSPVRAKGDGKYKGGLFVKDVSSGIGTVTFIDPKTGEFGALGHGICDRESGALSPTGRGVATESVITGIVKGQKGTPGELRGYLKSTKCGALLKNTDCGVFGVLTKYEGEAIPVAKSSEVKVGKALLRTALDAETASDYEIEITEIKKGATKSFTVRVTDPRLLEKTGGIVQGMSGSPIIQNGKLIGALTHVMVANPTEGYGIFIENMLNAAEG